jgi:hypothetical protein
MRKNSACEEREKEKLTWSNKSSRTTHVNENRLQNLSKLDHLSSTTRSSRRRTTRLDLAHVLFFVGTDK